MKRNNYGIRVDYLRRTEWVSVLLKSISKFHKFIKSLKMNTMQQLKESPKH